MIKRLRLQPFVIRLDPQGAIAHLEIGHFRVGKTGAEFLRLRVHVHDQLRAVDAFGKAGKILHQRGGGQLAAGLPAFEHERVQVRARGVNGGGQTGATAPDNDHFFHSRT